ncbi:lipocalin family protein [Chlorobium sp. N1]|uniref:lipocalin family protein n=1 Tax=Chlorobium sp. N1 TaxID=2491138 RepID=UPI00103B13A5|nr:lipocalin family protein [Chlorobium sp. N1]TCD47640.1 lipocalin [Chlorobium sp. N1]
MKITALFRRALCILLLVPAGCTGVPEGLEPVGNFSLERYLGTWYEIARIPNSFEKDFEEVSATYTLSEDGSVRVENRGYDGRKQEWKSVKGRAKFAGAADRGALEVSFFGPFYASYNVLVLDPEYRWALVSGHDRDLLWILGRSPVMEEGLYDELRKKAAAMGFDASKIRRVARTGANNKNGGQ